MAVKKKALGWELITDRETYGKVTEKRLKEQLERLEQREIEFLVLQPSHMIGETAYLQASYESDPSDGMLYGIEFGLRMEDGKDMILRNYPAPQSQLEKIFEEYFTAHRVPISADGCSSIFSIQSPLWAEGSCTGISLPSPSRIPGIL